MISRWFRKLKKNVFKNIGSRWFLSVNVFISNCLHKLLEGSIWKQTNKKLQKICMSKCWPSCHGPSFVDRYRIFCAICNNSTTRFTWWFDFCYQFPHFLFQTFQQKLNWAKYCMKKVNLSQWNPFSFANQIQSDLPVHGFLIHGVNQLGIENIRENQ